MHLERSSQGDEIDRACNTWRWTWILVGLLWEKPEAKRPLGRPRLRWKGNIKMDLRGIEFGGMDWMSLPEDSNEPSGSVKCWNCWVAGIPQEGLGSL